MCFKNKLFFQEPLHILHHLLQINYENLIKPFAKNRVTGNAESIETIKEAYFNFVT